MEAECAPASRTRGWKWGTLCPITDIAISFASRRLEPVPVASGAGSFLSKGVLDISSGRDRLGGLALAAALLEPGEGVGGPDPGAVADLDRLQAAFPYLAKHVRAADAERLGELLDLQDGVELLQHVNAPRWIARGHIS